jgi:hypothetical protein
MSAILRVAASTWRGAPPVAPNPVKSKVNAV